MQDAGTIYGVIENSSSDLLMRVGTSDKDIVFKGLDAGNDVIALKLDMSEAGKAIFNGAVTVGGNLSIAPASNTPYIMGGTVSTVFRNNANSASLITILDGGHVGIGTSSPDANSFGAGHGVLSVNSATGSAKTAMVNIVGDGNDTANTRVSSLFFNDASATGAGATLAGVEAYRATNHATDPGANLLFSTNASGGSYTERMRIASDGIVTIRPDTGATTGTLRLHNGNGNGTLGQIDFGHSGSVHHGSILYTGNMDFHTGASADSRFFIGMNGEVGINTTSPEHHLHVTEPGTSKEDGIVKIGGSSAALGLELSYNQSGATTTEIVANPTYTNVSSLMRICVDRDANANQISLLGNGKIGMGTDTPNSNARLTLNGGIRFSTTPWSTGDALNVISANTFTNYNVANTITTVYYKMFILTIYGSGGYNQSLFLANAGGGTGFGFTVLRPDSATPVSGNLASGFTIDATGSGNEEFEVRVTYGGGSLSVKRVAADNTSSSWGVFIHVLSG